MGSIERLELLFSRRKHVASRRPAADKAGRSTPAAASAPVPAPPAPAAAAVPAPTPTPEPAPSAPLLRPEPKFPQASFIRPRASRMMPREDSATTAARPATAHGRARPDDTLAVEQENMVCPNGRFPSVDSAFAAKPSSLSSTEDDSVCTADGSRPTGMSMSHRSLSLRGRRKPSITLLRGISSFPLTRFSTTITTSSGEISPMTAAFPVPPCSRTNTDTPPPSDPDEKPSVAAQNPPHSQPTTEASPKMSAVSTTEERPLLQRDSIVSVIPARDSISEPLVSPTALRKPRATRPPGTSHVKRQLPGEREPRLADSVLKEPNWDDFLSLSDEDIAEAELATPAPAAVPVVAPAASEPVTPSPKKRFSLYPSPVRSRPFCREAAPSKPPSCMAPPPPVLPVPTMFLCERTAVPTSPNRSQTPSSQLRMVAALEIARIASQYKFDLAYIATIWPKNMTIQSSTAFARRSSSPVSPGQMPRPTSQISSVHRFSGCSSIGSASSSSSARSTATATASLGSQGSPAKMHPRSGLEAQFLAAYGLATVKAPYSLSEPTHARMLNAERWLQFNEPNARAHEFSTGYGCAFYQGHVPVASRMRKMGGSGNARHGRQPSTEDCDADTEQDDESGRATPRPTRPARPARPIRRAVATNNRGIVFVAYRRKGTGEESQAAQTEPDGDDLDGLYHDVEKLVDRILDFHMMQQRQEQLEMLRASTMEGAF